MAKLLVHETAGVREFEIVDAETQIGRELDNALRLADPSISRHHAVLRRTADGYEIHDNQSSNGVLVNGNRVQSLPLQDGDRVTLGQVQMTFVDPRNAPTEAISITNPLGTVRMTPDEMARIRALQEGSEAPAPEAPAPVVPSPAPMVPPVEPVMPVAPPPPPVAPVPPAPVPPPPAPVAPAPLTPPPPAPMAPPPAPMAPPPPMASAPVPPSPHVPPVAPLPPMGSAHAGDNPAPAFLRAYLPPIPDDARPTGERGDFVTRLLAHLIDAAIFIVPMIVLNILSTLLFGLLVRVIGLGAVGAIGCLFTLFYLALSAAMLLFWPWCWIKFGATPGKKIMKLRVVPEDNPYGRVDVGTAVLRLIGHMLNFGIGYLLILINEDRKGVQDIISKSIVIKVDR